MVPLLAVVIILLWTVRSHQMRADVRNEEQSRQFQNIEALQREAREAQLKNMGEMQNKLEQRFAEVQQGIEKRLGEMSSQQVEKLGSSSEKSSRP